MIYGDFDDFGRFWKTKNKANLSLREQTQYYLAPSSAVGFNTNLKKQSQFANCWSETLNPNI